MKFKFDCFDFDCYQISLENNQIFIDIYDEEGERKILNFSSPEEAKQKFLFLQDNELEIFHYV
jgi:hypothetical protein